jgi:hypothetical protein
MLRMAGKSQGGSCGRPPLDADDVFAVIIDLQTDRRNG